MKRILALSVATLLLSACHLYIEQDEDEPAVADADVVDIADAAIPEDCVETSRARAELNACFDFAQYESLGLCDLANLATSMGTCSTCHAGGGDGIQLNPNCNLTFQGWAVQENFEDLLTIEDEGGCIASATVGKVCSSALIGGEIHPPFTCPNNIRDGLQMFIDSALAGARAGTCE